MTRLVASLAAAGAFLVLGVVACPSVEALPAEPVVPCLPGGLCLPEELTDPLPDPVGLPPMPVDTPELPPTDVVPGLPVNGATEPAPTAATPTPAPVPAPAPAPAPDAAAPDSASSAEDAGPARAPSSGGGDGSRPTSISTSSTSSRPAAVARAARSFTLLFVLVALVGGYLVIQGRLDARDPKLVAAPIDRDDEVIRFE